MVTPRGKNSLERSSGQPSEVVLDGVGGLVQRMESADQFDQPEQSTVQPHYPEVGRGLAGRLFSLVRHTSTVHLNRDFTGTPCFRRSTVSNCQGHSKGDPIIGSRR